MGLNLILWLCFLVFAIILIVFFTFVQNYQNNQRYRAREEENLSEACMALKEILENEVILDLNGVMLSVANQYSVSAYLFTEDGGFVFPQIPESEHEQYIQIYRMLKEQFDAFEEEFRKENPIDYYNTFEEKARIYFSNDDYASYATIVNISGSEYRYYLYMTSSFEHLHAIMRDTLWNSLTAALFAIALSILMSGVVSMVIAKPVTNVTNRAKSLAHGEFDDSRHDHYFCTELNDLSQALDYAGTEISKADRMQKELIANVSHDFRTPLTMIKAYAAMIQEISGDDPVKRAKHTQIIIDESDRLATLVGDLLDLSRLQAGMENFEWSVFNLSEDLYGVANRFGFLTFTRGYTINTEIDDDLYTRANKERVEQVLYNLIGNAVNYTGEDKTVTIRLKKKEGCARFEVIDSGKGIPPEEIETIWERYYRSSEMHTRPVKGTGLGLSIVKNILKAHDFAFGVESEVGKGSCFWVEFPDPPEA